MTGSETELRERTVRGLVLPTAWDCCGQAMGIAILGAGEEHLEVVDEGLGHELLQRLRDEIEAQIRPVAGQPERVHILSYAIIEPCVVNDPPRCEPTLRNHKG